MGPQLCGCIWPRWPLCGPCRLPLEGVGGLGEGRPSSLEVLEGKFWASPEIYFPKNHQLPCCVARWGFKSFFKNMQRQKRAQFSHHMQWPLPEGTFNRTTCALEKCDEGAKDNWPSQLRGGGNVSNQDGSITSPSRIMQSVEPT